MINLDHEIIELGNFLFDCHFFFHFFSPFISFSYIFLSFEFILVSKVCHLSPIATRVCLGQE
jgi:hypothetical protein